jgi:tetratricopeptide (TPR) repeat protein
MLPGTFFHDGLFCVISCLLPNQKKNEGRAMHELTPPDSHFLNAAIGWCELGNFAEARAELHRITAPNRDHPHVLVEEWRIYAAEKQWLPALEVARRLIEVAPDIPAGWIDQSYSLHEMKLTQEARNQLALVADKFPAVSTIPYNLACYACQLGNLAEARQWLAKAIEISGAKEIKPMALADPDLLPMWDEIKKW